MNESAKVPVASPKSVVNKFNVWPFYSISEIEPFSNKFLQNE